ncbi:hypothetical protein [Sphingobacterium multivorum]|uniref:hypothetical protein n=1 Tax=Sphingobacterium multivorum TaxID=28454 RepID=UPI000E91207A|nr:hypothetical protein [Sphingobacterium multivorum]HBI89197.1 hypothetical protein [Sphingobacterium sp.]
MKLTLLIPLFFFISCSNSKNENNQTSKNTTDNNISTKSIDTLIINPLTENEIFKIIYPNNNILENNTLKRGFSKKMLSHELEIKDIYKTPIFQQYTSRVGDIDLSKEKWFREEFYKTSLFQKMYFKRDGIQKLFVITYSKEYSLSDSKDYYQFFTKGIILKQDKNRWSVEKEFENNLSDVSSSNKDLPLIAINGVLNKFIVKTEFAIENNDYLLLVTTDELRDGGKVFRILSSYNIETMIKKYEKEIGSITENDLLNEEREYFNELKKFNLY